MAAMQSQFLTGCQRPSPQGPGLTGRQALTLWEQVLAFAGYGFNQGHATAYADVSYRSAYLKAHWPAAFMAARLAERGGYHHPAVYMAEAVRLGLDVRPPHVNHSSARFTLDWEGDQGILWMGLGRVRDLRRGSVDSIIKERKHKPFSSLRDLMARIDLQRKETVHLIQCGALDGLDTSRAALMAEAEDVQQAGSTLQMPLGFGRSEVKPETAAKRLVWEHDLLGQPVSVHPLEVVAASLPDHLPLRQLAENPGGRIVVTGVRLPGWTGSQGFYLGDSETFVIARSASSAQAPPPWKPLLVSGRWLSDEWGGSWLQVDALVRVEESGATQ
jgi:DNA polymerase III alpha subunit